MILFKRNVRIISHDGERLAEIPYPVPHPLHDILDIEYQALQLQMLSFPLQSVSARLLELNQSLSGSTSGSEDALTMYRLIAQDSKYSEDARMVQDAILRSRNLLSACIKLD